MKSSTNCEILSVGELLPEMMGRPGGGGGGGSLWSLGSM